MPCLERGRSRVGRRSCHAGERGGGGSLRSSVRRHFKRGNQIDYAALTVPPKVPDGHSETCDERALISHRRLNTKQTCILHSPLLRPLLLPIQTDCAKSRTNSSGKVADQAAAKHLGNR